MRILKRSTSPGGITGRHSPVRGSPVAASDTSPTSPRLLMGGKNSAFKALTPGSKPAPADAYRAEAPGSGFLQRPDALKGYFAEHPGFPGMRNGIESNDSVGDSDEEIHVNDESDEEKEREYIEMLKREREKMEKEGAAHGQPLELTTRDREKS